MISIKSEKTPSLHQGDIIENVDHIEYVVEKDGIIEVSTVIFPLVIVLTQDCDLTWDYTFRQDNKPTQDKYLISALVAPLYNAEHVFQGNHLDNLGRKMVTFNKKSSSVKALKNNETPRYHYLSFPNEIQIVDSVIDFKHYFSVNIEYLTNLKEKHYICTVDCLFREDISQRFSNFLARIGLPEIQQ